MPPLRRALRWCGRRVAGEELLQAADNLADAALHIAIQRFHHSGHVLAGDGLFLLRLVGPGKVWLQSLTLPGLAHALAPYLPAAEASTPPSASSVATGAVIGGIAELLS